MVMPLYSSIEKLDRPLLEAAKDLGASRLQTFIRIIIPLTMPGIIAGCLLVMLPAMGLVLRLRPDGRREEPADRQRH
ncbi:Spermidine/putrescine transport system permease protein PotB [Raoultella terrigena]|uniref:Spermidine/putrescine transport system permease protein PotB n=1 Tax=Raoultella terrigena TaxID=577 RepID=A0A3P8KG31_RAOTE|nr:Spermidine/putrescine transport system permease protein PotB [Raoultella terrigena]